MLPQEILVILGVLRHILRHTEKHTELLEKRLIIIICIANPHPSPWDNTEVSACKMKIAIQRRLESFSHKELNTMR